MNSEQRPILVVEDSEEDFEITLQSIRLAGPANPVVRCKSGRQAQDYMHRRGEFRRAEEPVFALIDLNLPGVDGRQVLSEMRHNNWLGAVPCIVLSTSSNPRDIRLAYQLGAAGYLIKPVDLDRFEQMIRSLTEYWLSVVTLPDEGEFGNARAII